LCFGPPKGGKERDVPLPESVASAINDHTTRWPPRPVTLPWQTPTGPLVTARLVVYGADGGAIRRSRFNVATWHPALRRAGVTSPTRADGFHALRHFYASTLLDAGESIVALAEYLGHHDPAFTLRTYTHLLPSSQQRTPAAIDRVLHLPSDGVHTA
ncbi:MAG: tyrosine-type recombinase/integrase, partial [Pseudonocardiaceae bacterium]